MAVWSVKALLDACILRTMRISLRKFTPLLWLVAIALVGVRTTGAHVHLCRDGDEPRASVHVIDDALCETSLGAPKDHNDQDYDAVGDALAKKGCQDDALIPLAAACVVVAIVAPARVITERVTDAPAPKKLQLLRPPLRGPPA